VEIECDQQFEKLARDPVDLSEIQDDLIRSAGADCKELTPKLIQSDFVYQLGIEQGDEKPIATRLNSDALPARMQPEFTCRDWTPPTQIPCRLGPWTNGPDRKARSTGFAIEAAGDPMFHAKIGLGLGVDQGADVVRPAAGRVGRRGLCAIHCRAP
jgi:hypothetical protein